MLERIGVASVDALFEDVLPRYRLAGDLALEPALDELSLMRHLGDLATRNSAASMLSFLGGGMYAHHVPPAVDQLLLRSEFYTAYTPYQAEVAQGTLQSIFEFQTIVGDLLGMPLANASMYDGASAAAEAVLMTQRITGRRRVVLSAALHPQYIDTVRTYLHGHGEDADLVLAPVDANLRTDWQATAQLLDASVAAVVVGYPNFFGCIEDLRQAHALANGCGALLITATTEPYALSVLKPPGSFGADIAVAEGQALAVPPQFGGPGVGLFACRQEHLRQMPGRLVGETVDAAGVRGYVLALSTREQHIRRERATSNICTNHGLVALALVIRTALLGKRGFVEVGRLCLERAAYLKQRVAQTPGFSLASTAPTFNEFVVRSASKSAREVVAAMADRGILAGIDLGRYFPERANDFLVAVTELQSRADIDRYVDALEHL